MSVLRRTSLYSLAVAILSLAAIVFSALFGRGFVDGRILAPAAVLLVVPGLFWGVYLGRVIMGRLPREDSYPARLRALQAGSLAVALVVAVGIAAGQVKLIPSFQAFAQGWDARHGSILTQIQNGSSEIKVVPLAFELADYVGVVRLEDDPANRCARRFYGVDAIAIGES